MTLGSPARAFPTKGMCSETLEGAGVSSESRRHGGEKGGHLGKGGCWGGGCPCPLLCTCSWLRQGPYLSFTQVIRDEPDEDWPRACVGRGGCDGDHEFGVSSQWHFKGLWWQAEQAAYPHGG